MRTADRPNLPASNLRKGGWNTAAHGGFAGHQRLTFRLPKLAASRVELPNAQGVGFDGRAAGALMDVKAMFGETKPGRSSLF